jgi:hypothetical protein
MVAAMTNELAEILREALLQEMEAAHLVEREIGFWHLTEKGIEWGRILASVAPRTPPPQADDGREYLLTEGQALFLTMLAAADKDARGAQDICHDMVKVIMAWRRGKLLPKWEVPKLAELCKDFETPDWPPNSSKP